MFPQPFIRILLSKLYIFQSFEIFIFQFFKIFKSKLKSKNNCSLSAKCLDSNPDFCFYIADGNCSDTQRVPDFKRASSYADPFGVPAPVTNLEEHTLSGHRGPVLCFARLGEKLLFSGSTDCNIKVFPTSTLRSIIPLTLIWKLILESHCNLPMSMFTSNHTQSVTISTLCPFGPNNSKVWSRTPHTDQLVNAVLLEAYYNDLDLITKTNCLDSPTLEFKSYDWQGIERIPECFLSLFEVNQPELDLTFVEYQYFHNEFALDMCHVVPILVSLLNDCHSARLYCICIRRSKMTTLRCFVTGVGSDNVLMCENFVWAQ